MIQTFRGVGGNKSKPACDWPLVVLEQKALHNKSGKSRWISSWLFWNTQTQIIFYSLCQLLHFDLNTETHCIISKHQRFLSFSPPFCTCAFQGSSPRSDLIIHLPTTLRYNSKFYIHRQNAALKPSNQPLSDAHRLFTPRKLAIVGQRLHFTPVGWDDSSSVALA